MILGTPELSALGGLVPWCRAQLDEDERRALAAPPGPWRANAEHDEVLAADDIPVADGFALSGPQLRAAVDHIVAHDPDWALREIETKRRIVDECAYWWDKVARGDEYPALSDRFEVALTVLRLLASSLADRPGYRKEWQP